LVGVNFVKNPHFNNGQDKIICERLQTRPTCFWLILFRIG
jgi:hypothetical protein